jgi:hypothetical protein
MTVCQKDPLIYETFLLYDQNISSQVIDFHKTPYEFYAIRNQIVSKFYIFSILQFQNDNIIDFSAESEKTSILQRIVDL